MQRELHDGTYQPGAYRLFRIYECNPRIITAAPFRDQVVVGDVNQRHEFRWQTHCRGLDQLPVAA